MEQLDFKGKEIEFFFFYKIIMIYYTLGSHAPSLGVVDTRVASMLRFLDVVNLNWK